MGTLEEGNENKNIRAEQRKHWLYIIGFLLFFFLIGSCVKWLSTISHGLH
jgi:hypothetical protein